MVPESDPLSNAVICSPGAGFETQQYHFLNTSFEGLVPDPTPGTGNFSCSQVDGITIMTFSRGVDNGNPADAQISKLFATNVMWAIGQVNVFGSLHPHMDSLPVHLFYDCSSLSSCDACTAGSNLCNWCEVDSACHVDGSFENPCSIAENIDSDQTKVTLVRPHLCTWRGFTA